MEYAWNVKTLEKRIRHLNQLKKKTTSSKQKNIINKDIAYLLEMISFLQADGRASYQSQSLLSRLENEDELLSLYYSMWSPICQFARIIKRENTRFVPEQFFSFSKNDILELTHDFYRDTVDSSFLPFFYKTFSRKEDYIHFSNHSTLCGTTCYISTLDEAFIEAQNIHKLSDIITLIHEFAHVILFRMNLFQQYDLSLYPFWEYFSLFIENIAFDYFSKIPTFANSAILDKQKEWACYKNDAYDLAQILKILDSLQGTTVYGNRHLKLLIWQNLGICENALEELLKTPKNVHLSYVASYMLVIELMHLYYKDQEMCWFTIKQIMAIHPADELDFLKQLLKLGIRLNEHTREYDQIMQRKRSKKHEEI